MSQLHLGDEILMAFADGELDEPMAAAVAKVMAEDPTVAKRIMEFQQSRRLTRSAYSAALMDDVTPELREAVSAQVKAYEDAIGRHVRPEAKVLKLVWPRPKQAFAPAAMAAAIAALSLALGYFMGWRSGSWPESPMAHLESPTVHRELDRVASGKDVGLPFGRLRVISTYRLADDTLCREFRLQSDAKAARAVACRDGGWNTRLVLADAADDAGYAPSSGGELMSEYLQSLGAGEPLVDGAEASALAAPSR